MYEIVLTAQLYLKIFSPTTSLSKYLQTDGMYVLKIQYIVDSTVEVLKKESRNFGNVPIAAKLFVSWSNNDFERCSIHVVKEEVLPIIHIPKKKF